jgi:hypothetical protein
MMTPKIQAAAIITLKYCTACGADNGTCCNRAPACNSGLPCQSGVCPTYCGSAGQNCCYLNGVASACKSGLSCVGGVCNTVRTISPVGGFGAF